MKRPIILPFSEQVTNIPQYEYINHFGMIPPNDHCEVVFIYCIPIMNRLPSGKLT